MTPNPQQALVVEHGEGPCLVLAVPGSGKTASVTERTARLISGGVDPRSILCITFTNKAANEMKHRIASAVGQEKAAMMTISTFHALCSRIIRYNAPLLGLTERYSIYKEDAQERLLKRCIHKIEGDVFKPTKKYMWSLMGFIEGKRNACLTDMAAAQIYGIDGNQPKVAEMYFQELKSLNALDFTGLLSEANRLFNEHPEIRDKYRNRFKFISVDEVQDTNIVQYEIIKHLGLGHKNVVIVGDLDQCIPSDEPIRMADGTAKPISNIAVGDKILSAGGRGRIAFGDVKTVVKKRYSGKVLRITTERGMAIRCTPNHVLFGKANPLPNKWLVYLMYKAGKGFRIGRAKGCRSETPSTSAFGLKVRMNQEHADRAWVLKVCDTLCEAAYFEIFFSIQYGIPTVCFHCCGRGLAMDQQFIDKLYSEIDSSSGALRLMAERDIFFDYPILIRQGSEETGRSVITLSMFGHRTAKKPCGHLVTLHGGSSDLRQRIESIGLKVTPSKRDMWRYRRACSCFAEAEKIAKDMAATDLSLMIVRKAIPCARKMNSGIFIDTPASHFHKGMSIAVCSGENVYEDIVVDINEEQFDGFVYDLEIKDICNFVSGNGIVAHNSIYKFRNACPENILKFEQDFSPCKILKLEKNYRSTPSILKHAQKLIEHNTLRKGTELRTDNADQKAPKIYGAMTDWEMAELIAEGVQDHINAGTIPKEIVVLYRTNYASRVLETAFRNLQIKYRIIGGTSFWDRKEVKSAMAVLSLLCNWNDQMAFEHAAEACCRGAGEKTLAIAADISKSRHCGIVDAVRIMVESGGAGGRSLQPLLGAFYAATKMPPGQGLLHIAQKTAWWGRLEEDSTDTNDRCANVTEMARDVDEYMGRNNKNTLAGYLQSISLLTDADDDQDDSHMVRMMTLHGCKGLEFDVVYISHCNEEIIPHARVISESPNQQELASAIEEERRLLYVGMTRARKSLTLCYMLTKQNKEVYPSRFLRETGIPMGVGAIRL